VVVGGWVGVYTCVRVGQVKSPAAAGTSADRYHPSGSSTAANDDDDAVPAAAIVVHVVGRDCSSNSLVDGQVWDVGVLSCGGMVGRRGGELWKGLRKD